MSEDTDDGSADARRADRSISAGLTADGSVVAGRSALVAARGAAAGAAVAGGWAAHGAAPTRTRSRARARIAWLRRRVPHDVPRSVQRVSRSDQGHGPAPSDPERPAYHRVAGGRPVADRGQVGRPGRVHRHDLARRPQPRHLAGRVAQRVEQLELGPVVLGHRREVLVEGPLQELERVDRLLRPADQDQDVAEPAGLLQALEGPVEGDDAGAEGAIGLDDPGRRRLDARVGPVHLLRHHVLGVEEVDDGQRLHAALRP